MRYNRKASAWCRTLSRTNSTILDTLNLTDQQKAELAALAAMSDHEIDTSDIPEIPTDWANAKRGVFHNGQVVKQQVTLWFEDLDDEVVAWLKANASEHTGL